MMRTNNATQQRRASVRTSAGFTLIELLIAVALSLMILAGLLSVFVNNSNTRKEIERTTRQIENGRYASELLSNNLAHAGFLAEFDPSTGLTAPGAVPDACSTVPADILSALALPIQGYRNATSSTPGLSCLTDLKSGTDVVVVRRTSTCVAGTSGCDPVTNGAAWYFQASLCNPVAGNAELAGPPSGWYLLTTNTSTLTNTATAMHRRTCTTAGCTCATAPIADIRRYHTHIFYVANNNIGSDGVPTLKRAELGGAGFVVVPLVEGIENLKFVYGIDTNNDGMPENYTETPATVADWRNVTSAKIFLLARNTELSTGYTDTKTYTLDSATTAGPFNDGYRRHVFSTSVKLTNVAGRRGT